MKDVYGIIPSAESARNWVPSLKTAGWIAGGVGLLVGITYTNVNRGSSIAGNSFNVAGNSTNGTESDASISNSSSVYYRPTDQQIKQSQIYEASKKLADAKKFAENNFGISEEDEPQWSKDLHKSETTEEIMDGDTLSNLFYEGNNSGYQFATSNVTEPARISETIGSNQTSVVRHSSVDTSDTCPANSYTSLEKYNIGTCPSQDVCSNKTSSLWSYIRSFISFGSREHRVNTNVTHTESSKTVGSSQTAVARYSNVDTSGTCPSDTITPVSANANDGTCPNQDYYASDYTSLPHNTQLSVTYKDDDVCPSNNGNISSEMYKELFSDIIAKGKDVRLNDGKIEKSPETALAKYDNTDTSDTCPANSYTSLEKYNIGTCPSQDVYPNETSGLWSYIRSFIPFGSHEYHVNTVDSSVKDSGYQFATPNVTEPARISETIGSNQTAVARYSSVDTVDSSVKDSSYQFAKPNVTEPARISETIGSNQTTIPDNVTVSTDKYAERELCSVDGDNKSTFANLSSASVDNGINTSRQQGTFFDSVDLKKLTREVHPSAYPNSLPGVF
ncbi:hypothetical protein [Wolbachia endosymbiont (group A) of Anomoia purmunda]|uniref:hypothetical protein n=1 Tax=Wolbachia endosymbiont (group A) of Anomoia purmunda TaxID=2953978 RepID=UPI0022316800|nr:hypothetical protein [Wolbachia endosymbiont (group A) of Anomoia purmunda]